MDLLPARPRRPPEAGEAEIVEPEIVGVPPPPAPWWRRLLARAAFAALLGLGGLVLVAVGAVLTITVVGAGIGVPLLILGVAALGAAAWFALGGGRFTVIRR